MKTVIKKKKPYERLVSTGLLTVQTIQSINFTYLLHFNNLKQGNIKDKRHKFNSVENYYIK